MTDYFDMIERRAAHPHSFLSPTDESSYQMQLDAFVKRYGPFKDVRRGPDFLNEWSVVATREDGSVLRAAFMRPLHAERITPPAEGR